MKKNFRVFEKSDDDGFHVIYRMLGLKLKVFNVKASLRDLREQVEDLKSRIMPGFFADLLTFVLGFILVMGGVQQIASLSAARRWTPVPGGFYVVPVAILLAGLVALFNPTGVRSTAFIIIGITSLVYAVSELINWFKFTRLRPKAPVAGSKSDDDIEDAKIIE